MCTCPLLNFLSTWLRRTTFLPLSHCNLKVFWIWSLKSWAWQQQIPPKFWQRSPPTYFSIIKKKNSLHTHTHTQEFWRMLYIEMWHRVVWKRYTAVWFVSAVPIFRQSNFFRKLYTFLSGYTASHHRRQKFTTIKTSELTNFLLTVRYGSEQTDQSKKKSSAYRTKTAWPQYSQPYRQEFGSFAFNSAEIHCVSLCLHMAKSLSDRHRSFKLSSRVS